MERVAVYYINLDSREDRNKAMCEELERMNLKAERVSAIVNARPALGCTKSHIEVLKRAQERDAEYVLVLEDDFDFEWTRADLDQRLEEFLRTFPDFDVIMFTYSGLKGDPTAVPHVGKLASAHNAGSYLVSKKYIPTLLANFEDSLLVQQKFPSRHWEWAHDQYWKSLQGQDAWYFFHPPVGFQREGFSDIAKRFRSKGELRRGH